MLQVARLAPRHLDDAAALVIAFILDRLNPGGGFQDRAGASDLYYTVFGLESLIALRAGIPATTRDYLRSFGAGDSLDFVHACSLARCWANLTGFAGVPFDEVPSAGILARIEHHREADGGFGSVYHALLALGAYQDLRSEIPARHRILSSIRSLATPDGGYSNHPGLPMGQTPATAAAAVLFRQFDEPPDPTLPMWLLDRCHPHGGFFAMRGSPMPDLLSTATALHALGSLHAKLDAIREPCLDFLDSLWSNRGGFFGNWSDDEQDCEYTYYALLSLGHLCA
jgi:hypothetical protein